MRTSQQEFLGRCGSWATPALGAWMATAAGLTAVGPLLLTGRNTDERAARAAIRPLASVLVVQVGLETALGRISDKAHPVVGLAFSLHRLVQIRWARETAAFDRTPRVHRLLDLQRWFWRGNVVMLLVTVVGRTVMRPRR